MSVNILDQNGNLKKIAHGFSESKFNTFRSDVINNIEMTDMASKDYAVGDFLIMANGQLVQVTSVIYQDTTINLSNVRPTTVEEMISKKVDITDLGTAAYKAVGSANGVAELDANGHVPSSQLPSYVDDVIEGYYCNGDFYADATYPGYLDNGVFYEDQAKTIPYPPVEGVTYYDITGDKFYDYETSVYVEITAPTPITPEASKIYIDLLTDTTYRWGGSTYVAIGSSLALGETSSTAYRGDRGKSAYDHATESGKVSAAVTTGLYKIGVTAEGHISEAIAVQPSDLNAGSVNGISFSLEE